MDEWSERCNDAGFEDVGRGPRAKECEQPLEAEKGKEKNSSLEPPKQKF